MQPRAHTLAALLALLQLALSSLLSEAAASATEGGIDEGKRCLKTMLQRHWPQCHHLSSRMRSRTH